MSEVGKKLETVLEGYANFLRERESVLPNHQCPLGTMRATHS